MGRAIAMLDQRSVALLSLPLLRCKVLPFELCVTRCSTLICADELTVGRFDVTSVVKTSRMQTCSLHTFPELTALVQVTTPLAV